MEYATFNEFFRDMRAPIPCHELLQAMTQTTHQCLFVKDDQSRYLYANDNFIRLMGLINMQQLRDSSDLPFRTVS